MIGGRACPVDIRGVRNAGDLTARSSRGAGKIVAVYEKDAGVVEVGIADVFPLPGGALIIGGGGSVWR